MRKKIITNGLMVASALVLLSGCGNNYGLSIEKVTNDFRDTQTCSSTKECETMWARANVWLSKHSQWKIQSSNEYLISTHNPINYSPSYGFSVSREPFDNGYKIELSTTYCGNGWGCDLEPNQIKMAFNKYIKTGEDVIPKIVTGRLTSISK